MTPTVKVILNPFGGRVQGQARIERTQQALDAAGVAYALETSQYPGHSIELARQAALEGWPIVAAAGGDGTINEVVNGLMQAAGEGQAGTLGIVPLGTANDLADGLKLPRSTLTAACRRLVEGTVRVIDVGQVNDRYFVNNSAIGLEALVTQTHDRMRWVRGNARYILAALTAIVTARPWHMHITWPDNRYDGPAILVSVGNTNRTGGKFYMTPHAVVDDGLLDFIFTGNLNRWQLVQLLPKTFSGAHIRDPRLTYQQTTTLSITVSPATPIQADGEIFEPQATHIEYRLHPQKLRVIT
jgi:diacylglycerol kinase (ATP)